MIDPVAIERLADAAWPSAEQAPLGPWKLRATHGVTRRANSVFTAGGADLADDELTRMIAEAEGFYSRRSLNPVFQISDATGAKTLDAALARRGYRIGGESEVWTLRSDRPPASDFKAAWIPRQADEPSAPWFDCAFDELPERRRVHEQIVRRVPQPRLFLSVELDGMVAGCGMAVRARGHCGIFCMATRAAHQRRGIASCVVNGLCEWARSRRDGVVYLQVMRDNQPAIGLYRRAGFEFAYSYHYRSR